MKKVCSILFLVTIVSFHIVFANEYKEYQEYKVIKGDTLWHISEIFYKNPFLWKKIFDANIDKIKNPDLIYPGQVFVIPKFNLENDEVSSKKQSLKTFQNMKEVTDENLKKVTLELEPEIENDKTSFMSEKEIVFNETKLLGKIVGGEKNKMFYTDGDILYISLPKNLDTEISEGEICYIYHKGSSKYDISLQNVKNDELTIIGKARVKNVKGNIVELYLIRTYSPVTKGDFVVK